MSCRRHSKKKVTGRYQLQFPLDWVRQRLSGRTAEQWRSLIMLAYEDTTRSEQQKWRESFKAVKNEMMGSTLTVENRTGRRFDRDAYKREAKTVYGACIPDQASPKLLSRCFQHSIEFIMTRGLLTVSSADVQAMSTPITRSRKRSRTCLTADDSQNTHSITRSASFGDCFVEAVMSELAQFCVEDQDHADMTGLDVDNGKFAHLFDDLYDDILMDELKMEAESGMQLDAPACSGLSDRAGHPRYCF